MTQPQPPASSLTPSQTPSPSAPASGYAAPSGYAPAPSTGRASWALGFLAFIPAVGLLVAAIGMLAAYGSARRSPSPLTRGNGRAAANWALTVFLIIALCALYIVVLLIAAPQTRTAGFFPIGAAVLVYAILYVLHLVVTLVGTIVAGTRVFRGPGIPFLRPRP